MKMWIARKNAAPSTAKGGIDLCDVLIADDSLERK